VPEISGRMVEIRLLPDGRYFDSITFIDGEEPKTEKKQEKKCDVKLPSKYSITTYLEMEKTQLETTKKGPMELTYASWAESWGALKRLHPTAQFEVHEQNGMPLFYNPEFLMMGAFVKVSVTVEGLTHTVHLPVMNHANKSLKLAEMSTFDINKNIMRCLAKAIALHGIGLYIYQGEDFPTKE